MTSSPTSKFSRPIAGPSQAMMPSGSEPIAATVAPSTPLARPRQPACAAPTTEPSRAANNTGMQSATWIAHTTPGCLVTAASARGRRDSISCSALAVRGMFAASSSTTDVPCTCSSHTGSDGSRPSLRTRTRFSRTAAGLSPTCTPVLSESQGAALTPPRRVVITAPIFVGASHSGAISSICSSSAITVGAGRARYRRSSHRLRASRARQSCLAARGPPIPAVCP